MPRIFHIYRNLLKSLNPQEYLLEMRDYSDKHVSIKVYSQEGYSGLIKIEDTIPQHRKASVDEKTLRVTDLGTKKEFLVSENELSKNFLKFE